MFLVQNQVRSQSAALRLEQRQSVNEIRSLAQEDQRALDPAYQRRSSGSNLRQFTKAN